MLFSGNIAVFCFFFWYIKLATGWNEKQHLYTKEMDMSNKGNISCPKSSVVNKASVQCCAFL